MLSKWDFLAVIFSQMVFGATSHFPLNQPKKFEGITLSWVGDKILGDIFHWYSPILKKEAGMEVASGEFFTTAQGYEWILPQLIAKESRWDLMVSTPQYLGDFIETGGVQPLDDFFIEFGKTFTEKYWEEVLPVYRDFYSQADGKTWAIPLDGDLLALHYRPSYFEDPKLKEKFLKTRRRELTVPETWEELDEVAQFFTQELKSKNVYGIQLAGTAPWVWSYWYTRAAAYGVRLFDEQMNPEINTELAAKSLEDFVNLIQWSPPGVENLGGDRLVKNWQAGNTVMSLWYFDLTELGGINKNFQGDVATVPVPGVRQKDGKISRYALAPYSRVALIPKNISEKRKRAAFYAALRLSEKSISQKLVGDSRCGIDPFLKSHYELAESFTIPNSEAGAKEIVFPSLSQARAHLAAGKATMEFAWPQPTWPGSSQYLYSLGSHIHKALLKQETPKQALHQTTREWKEILARYGKKDQMRAYQKFQTKLNKLQASRTLPAKGR